MRLLKTLVTLWLINIALCALPAVAAVTAGLTDEYFQSQFDWCMYVDVQTVPHYLNYQGSKLHPLSRVRVYSRKFDHQLAAGGKAAAAQLYEELWYADGTPLGLRRRAKLAVEPNHLGGVVLGDPGQDEQCRLAATNAMVRVLAELQLKQTVVSSVLVPEQYFDAVAADLTRYGFQPRVDVVGEGQQFSIHLQSYPCSRDSYYFWQK